MTVEVSLPNHLEAPMFTFYAIYAVLLTALPILGALFTARAQR